MISTVYAAIARHRRRYYAVRPHLRRALSQPVIDAAWQNQDITWDPVASSLKKNADDAYALGFLDKKADLSNFYDLTALNKVLKEKKLTEVKGLV